MSWKREGRDAGEGGRRGRIQFLALLEVFVIVEVIGHPFSPCAVVYAAVFAWDGRFGLAKGMGEGFGGGLVIGGRFGGRCCWLEGLR